MFRAAPHNSDPIGKIVNAAMKTFLRSAEMSSRGSDAHYCPSVDPKNSSPNVVAHQLSI
ncbi:hypothetical protein FNL39_10684 [Nocardia caishijiensis]|uniref:Uncharacterized protein n=1 Tax=Nocardia caishijiensis TaxID=184756 RepID=A0ABQ6YIT2_9NOCA|nr:hypothetical protein FNL39_10684 [Nocardia caishijiensis]